MILTQKFRPAASWRVKLAMFVLATAVLPIAATAVSVGEDTDSGESAKEAAVPAKNSRTDNEKSEKPVAGTETRQDAAKSVVAHWRLQRGLAGGVADSSQLIEDSSGNDRHGRAVGGPKYRSVNLPKSNLALAFDGHDDRIAITDDPLFHLTKSFTIEAYIQIDVYPGSAAKFSQIVFRGDNRMGFDPWFLAVRESGQLQFLVADALNNAAYVRSPEPIPTRQFVHVAGTLDDETGRMSLFINGKRVATTKTKIRACGALGGPGPGIGIGNRQVYSNHAFGGTIDEVRISAAALSPGEFLAPPVSER
ncbi:MAG: LamG domain-containing protein [Planctomycetota bacterium]